MTRRAFAATRIHLAGLLAVCTIVGCGGESTPTDPNGDGDPPQENRAPIVEFFADPYTLRTGADSVTVVELSTFGSRDPDDDALTVQWTVPGGTIVSGTDTSVTLEVSYFGTSARTVTLEVDDGRGGRISREFVLELGTGLTRFQKDYIDALFLGAGPFIPSDSALACPSWNERWSGFPRGTTVRVIVSTTVDGSAFDGGNTPQMIQDALVDIPYATAGRLTTTFEMTADPDPIPGPDEVTSTDHPDPQSTGCPFPRGCIHHGWRDPGTFTVFLSGRAVQMEDTQPADAFVHDVVGHGIMGLCHIDQASIGGNAMSLMPGGPGARSGLEADKLTPTDIAATRAVFASPLDVGATRAEFLAADLINRPGFSTQATSGRTGRR